MVLGVHHLGLCVLGYTPRLPNQTLGCRQHDPVFSILIRSGQGSSQKGKN